MNNKFLIKCKADGGTVWVNLLQIKYIELMERDGKWSLFLCQSSFLERNWLRKKIIQNLGAYLYFDTEREALNKLDEFEKTLQSLMVIDE